MNIVIPFVALFASVFNHVLTDGWTFSRDEGATWTSVRVPHDWGIVGPFDPSSKDGSTGMLPWRGKGLYRRQLVVSEDEAKTLSAGGYAYLKFDGVMASPRVRVNGQEAGGWDYGYMSFSLDVTKLLHAGSNLVEVSADTTHLDSRWYPGGGIYRKVVFAVRPREHVLPGTLAIRTPDVTTGRAVVAVSFATPTGSTNYSFTVEKPRLWDVNDPYLYDLDILGEKFRYGIRSARFTADDGFHLNGRRVQLKGVNLHSDLGLIGMAFDRSAMRRQLARMKDMGANAIRTSHNAPSPELLELCDETGFLVWNECFDKWDATSGRRAEDNLEDYVARNLRQFVRRDRNHPCVIAWSISNEIWEWDPAHPIRDTKNRWADRGPTGQTKARNELFCRVVREEDSTRPVANGNRPYLNEKRILDMGIFEPFDVLGFNYLRAYVDVHKYYPKKPLVYTESCSAVSSYGYYRANPLIGRSAWDERDTLPYQVDSRDLQTCIGLVDQEFDYMATDRYCAGEFVWTGIDYLGEPSPNDKNARSSYFGIVDLTGTPKDRYYLYRSHWRPAATTLHISPDSWTFPGMEGTNVPVMVYTDSPEAELFVNGRSLGKRRKGVPIELPPTMTNNCYAACHKYRLMWLNVPYEPGELKVVAYRSGVRTGERVLRTAGKPTCLVLFPEPVVGVDKGELCWIALETRDAAGVRVPNADTEFSVTLRGPGEILGVGNGNPCEYVPFPSTTGHRLFGGRAMIVVRRTGPGRIILKATAPGLVPAVAKP